MGKNSYCTSEAWSGLPKPQNEAGAGVLISFKLENLANMCQEQWSGENK